MTVEDRFLAKTSPEPNTGCWLWTGAVTRNGYGSVTHQRRSLGAHRLAFALFAAPIPHGMSVLHHCDTPLCVNPSHLWLGSQADNLKDMVRKGRYKSVRGHGRLTEDKVRAIRSRAASGVPQCALRREYGVCRSSISQIVNRKSWRAVA